MTLIKPGEAARLTIPTMVRCAFSIALAAVAAGPVWAQERTGFWAGVDAGAASLERTYSQTGSTRETEFAMAFRGGYAWNPRLLLGVELGGFTLQEAGVWEPDRGEAIQTFYAIVHWFPGSTSNLFVRAGFGYVSYWNNRPGETNASGSGYVLGAGYELTRWGQWRLESIIEFAGGEFDGAISPPGIMQDQRYQAVTLRLGVTYR